MLALNSVTGLAMMVLTIIIHSVFMVTLMTLGFGGVVLTGQWRTLASIQAANGVIIFGWTTALILYFIQHIYKED